MGGVLNNGHRQGKIAGEPGFNGRAFRIQLKAPLVARDFERQNAPCRIKRGPDVVDERRTFAIDKLAVRIDQGITTVVLEGTRG